jgi:hypothetical protein
MRQLVEAAIGAEVGIERVAEDERVGDQGPARVIADEQYRTGRYVVQAGHLAAKVAPADRGDRRQRGADVLRVARREWIILIAVAAEHVESARDVAQRRLQHPRGALDRVGRQSERAFTQRLAHNLSLPNPGKNQTL